MIGLDWVGLTWNWVGLDLVGLGWIGLNWAGLNSVALDWNGCHEWIARTLGEARMEKGDNGANLGWMTGHEANLGREGGSGDTANQGKRPSLVKGSQKSMPPTKEAKRVKRWRARQEPNRSTDKYGKIKQNMAPTKQQSRIEHPKSRK